MAANDELKDIKQILGQIRDQGQTQSGTGSQSSRDLGQYTRELKLARDELNLLDKGSGEYNRKLREVEKLTRQARNAMKDQRRETDLLTLSVEGVTGAMDMLGNAADKVIVKFGGLVKSIFDEVKQLDNLTMQFRASTGASAAMANNIGHLTDRLRMFGVSSAESAKAVDTLYKNFTAFSELNANNQVTLGETVGILSELGMSADTSSAVLDLSFRALNHTVEESNELLLDMYRTSKFLQVPIEQLSQDFQKAQTEIVALGIRGPEAFKKLESASKATGLGVDGILGISDKFKTFQETAGILSKMSTLYGKQFGDPQQLQRERQKGSAALLGYLQREFNEVGETFESFSAKRVSEKEMIAEGLGVSLVTISKLLKGDLSELEKAAENIDYTFEQMKKDAFGLKGFDEILTNTINSFKRPITEIGNAGRASFEAFEPMRKRFEEMNKDLIKTTEEFVANNSKLVGNAVLLYNLAGLDGVQQGYELFKGIASFSGSVLGNLFSIKGVLAVMVGGSFYLLREQIGDIYKILKDDGPVAAIKAIGAALTDVFNEYKLKALEMGFDKTFFDALKTKFKTFAITTYHTFRDEWLKPMFRTLQVEMIYHFEQMKSNGTFAKIGGMIADVFKFAVGSAISVALFAFENLLDSIPGISTLSTRYRAGLRAAANAAAPGNSGPARSRADIRADLAEGDRPKTAEERRERLAGRREVIDAVINDKIATMQLQNTKGMQTINTESAKAMKKLTDTTDETMRAIGPQLQDVKKEIENGWTSMKDMGEGLLEELKKVVKEMGDANDRAHENLANRPVILEVDKREFGRAVAAPAVTAINKHLNR